MGLAGIIVAILVVLALVALVLWEATRVLVRAGWHIWRFLTGLE